MRSSTLRDRQKEPLHVSVGQESREFSRCFLYGFRLNVVPRAIMAQAFNWS